MNLFEREWLVTNGLGGYASGTIAGTPTRRYHGMFMAALSPPVSRYLLAGWMREEVEAGGSRFALAALQTDAREGERPSAQIAEIASFRRRPYPVWTFETGDARLQRSILMPHRRQTAIVSYRNVGAQSFLLRVRPLLPFRRDHDLTHENGDLDGRGVVGKGILTVKPYASLPELMLYHNGCALDAESRWVCGIEYALERERGYDFREDVWSPAEFVYWVTPGEEAYLILSLEELDAQPNVAQMRAACEHRAGDIAIFNEPIADNLAYAADAFLVERDPGKSAGASVGASAGASAGASLIAGYPWFADWGRDAMVALPGLLLATRRYAEARSVLETWAASCRGGLLPNRFEDDGNGADYASADAPLWFAGVLREYALQSGDRDGTAALLPRAEEMLDAFRGGAKFGIRADDDDLIVQGADGLALTWMDARSAEGPLTPRRGKAVEVNALWYNALLSVADLRKRLRSPGGSKGYSETAKRVAKSFNTVFWDEIRGALFDVTGEGEPDASCRPNQLFAVGLPFSPLSAARQRSVFHFVRERLLTPAGLRSLEPGDPRYRGHCQGNTTERDAAYHQGSVWPWLLGIYLDAMKRVDYKAWERDGLQALAGAIENLNDVCVGSISEIFDGDPPHAPRGCPAQAWSVGEVLRSYVKLKGL